MIGRHIHHTSDSNQRDAAGGSGGRLLPLPWLGARLPKLQILTIAELLKGAEVKMPQQAMTTFRQAQQIREEMEQYRWIYSSTRRMLWKQKQLCAYSQ
jgi:hypothetical protein